MKVKATGYRTFCGLPASRNRLLQFAGWLHTYAASNSPEEGPVTKLRKAEINLMLAGTKSLTRVFYDNSDATEKQSAKNFILCSKKSVPVQISF
jgi:hypothetical protein